MQLYPVLHEQNVCAATGWAGKGMVPGSWRIVLGYMEKIMKTDVEGGGLPCCAAYGFVQ